MAGAGQARAACPKAALADLADAVTRMYAAVAAGDDAAANRILTPDFYLFEGGMRMSRTQILGFMDSDRAAGKHYAWSVNDADGRVSCADGWIAYLNKGSVTDASGVHPQEWLETAALHHDGTAWRIVFMQSTRVPKAGS